MSDRRLPHEYPEGRALFLTWHLHGSLPASRYPAPGTLKSGKAFVWTDRYLDAGKAGPLYLKQPKIATVVRDSILYCGDKLGYYDLEAWVLMANHVHLLAWPKASPTKFMRTLKGYTAREANKILHRTGEPFWQKESYDHWVRSPEELTRIARYIENNPVTAGLVQHPEHYPWSSAAWRTTSRRAASSLLDDVASNR